MRPTVAFPAPTEATPTPLDGGNPGHCGDNQRVQTESGHAAAVAAVPWRSAFANRSLATAFAGQAALYARLRPDYPTAALDVALPAEASRVLDLGAGTGKLTGPLLARGTAVIAVEPLESMLAELRRSFATAVAVCGAAEAIPLADATVDAVLVAQAFHWFDPALALPEIARVLRPGGTLSLLWNHDDDTDPLVLEVQAALDRAGRPPGGSTGRLSSRPVPFSQHPSFAEPELIEVKWIREQSVDDYIGLLHTYSYVIRAPATTRAQLAAEVLGILHRHQPGRQLVRIPVTCQVWRSTCL